MKNGKITPFGVVGTRTKSVVCCGCLYEKNDQMCNDSERSQVGNFCDDNLSNLQVFKPKPAGCHGCIHEEPNEAAPCLNCENFDLYESGAENFYSNTVRKMKTEQRPSYEQRLLAMSGFEYCLYIGRSCSTLAEYSTKRSEKSAK